MNEQRRPARNAAATINTSPPRIAEGAGGILVRERPLWARTFQTPIGVGRISPHLDRELKLLLAGEKPAALLTRNEARRAAAAGLPTARGRMGWMAGRNEDALERLTRAVSDYANGTVPQYVALGLALGYTPADIVAFSIKGTLIVLEGHRP